MPPWLQNEALNKEEPSHRKEFLPAGSLRRTLLPGQQSKPSLPVTHCPAVTGVLSLHAPPGCRFRLDYALSREQQNKRGGKMYIQDKVEEYADEVFDLLDNGAHIYFCGLKGMMPGGAGSLISRAESSMG